MHWLSSKSCQVPPACALIVRVNLFCRPASFQHDFPHVYTLCRAVRARPVNDRPVQVSSHMQGHNIFAQCNPTPQRKAAAIGAQGSQVLCMADLRC